MQFHNVFLVKSFTTNESVKIGLQLLKLSRTCCKILEANEPEQIGLQDNWKKTGRSFD